MELPVSEGIVLRQFTPSDAAPLFALIDRQREHLGQFGDTTAEKYPDLESVEKSIAEPPNPDRLRFGVWDNEVLVGTVNLTPRVKPDSWQRSGSAVIGYWIGSDFTRRGHATRAVDALTDYGHEQLGYQRIYATVDQGNRPSLGVLERAGYARIGEGPEKVIFVSDDELMLEDERQTDKEAAVLLGGRRGEFVYHDGHSVMAMSADGSTREIARAETLNVLWAVAALALEDEKPERSGEIVVGETYVLDGIRYRVDGFAYDATGYRETGELVSSVRYTQLDDGGYPAGTRYSRAQREFEEQFSLEK